MKEKGQNSLELQCCKVAVVERLTGSETWYQPLWVVKE